MRTLYAETPEEKRALAETLAREAPEVLDDLKMLGMRFGPFESVTLTLSSPGDVEAIRSHSPGGYRAPGPA